MIFNYKGYMDMVPLIQPTTIKKILKNLHKRVTNKVQIKHWPTVISWRKKVN